VSLLKAHKIQVSIYLSTLFKAEAILLLKAAKANQKALKKSSNSS
jgi:hypothetical protein